MCGEILQFDPIDPNPTVAARKHFFFSPYFSTFFQRRTLHIGFQYIKLKPFQIQKDYFVLIN